MARAPTSFVLVALALCSSCRVFDPALYLGREAGAGAEGGADADPDGAAPALVLGEHCAAAPLAASSSTAFTVDTTRLASDFKDLALCTGAELPGNDGFLAVQMQAGEKWHVHIATTDPAANPALYILPESCDERACVRGMGVDECGPGKPEHLSFFAPTAGRYVIGVDGREAGGATYSLIVIRPTCGDGATEHAETCDDGNTLAGDGCDSFCRRELAPVGASEAEPNDDYLAANVLAFTATSPASATAAAALGGRCDLDMFAVDVPEVPGGAALRAKLLTVSGHPCPLAAPELRLALIGPDGRRELGSGALRDGEGCPSIDERHAFAQGLPKGTYYLRATTAAAATFDYQILVTR